MRKFLTCALCFVPTLAGAITLYYDKSGECDGWWRGTTQTGCPASNLRVTKFHPTIQDSKVFNGMIINGETLVDSDGTLRSFRSLSPATQSAIQTDAANGVSLEKYRSVSDVGDAVTVKFDAVGGWLPGADSRQMGHGATLPTITEAREDGAIFDGWAQGSVNASEKQTVIGNDVADNTTYYARWTCPNGLTMNQHGTCVDMTGNTEYIDRSGNPVSSGNVNCWRYNTETHKWDNYCYWRVNITFHDKPTSGAGDITVSNGNAGLKLACNGGKGCTVKSGSCAEVQYGKCTKIYQPRANNYYFRGYYLDPPYQTGITTGLPNDIITDHSTTNGGAFNNFFPKNSNPVVDSFSITEHAVVVISEKAVVVIYNPGDPIGTSAPIDVDVYGGWARTCDPESVAHSNDGCHVAIGKIYDRPDNYGLGKGDVKYFANCSEGFYQPVDANAYNNVACVSENGQRYYKYTGNQCTPDDSETHMCNAAFALQSGPSCTDGYTFKGWRVGGQNYTAGTAIECNDTTLPHTNGYAEIRAIECPRCVAPEHGSCVQADGPFKCDTIKCEDGYDVCKTSDGASCILTGTPCGFYCPTEGFELENGMTISLVNSNMAQESCKYTIGCGKGYTLNSADPVYTCTGDNCSVESISSYVNNTYECQPAGGGNGGGTGGEIGGSYTCPTTIYTPTSGQHIVVSGSAQSTAPCTYTISCETGYTSLTGGNATVTCNSAETCEQLSFTDYSCATLTPAVKCPGAPNDWDANGTLASTSGANDCNYKLTCNTDQNFVVANSGSSSDTTFGCNGSTCTGQWLESMHTNKYCQVNCASTEYADSLENGGFDGSVQRVGYDKCKYTLKCDTDYTLHMTTGTENPYVCSGSDCTTARVRDYISNHYSCSQNFHCPEVESDLQVPTNGTLKLTNENTTNQTCTYSVGCDSSHAFPTGSNSPETISCSGTTSSNACTTEALQPRIDTTASSCRATMSSCPSATIVNGNVNSSLVNNNTACEYTVTCNSPAYTCSDCAVTCSGIEECNALTLPTCDFACPTAAYVKSQIPHAKTITLTTQSSQGCLYRLTECFSDYEIGKYCEDTGKDMGNPDAPGGGGDNPDDDCSSWGYYDSAMCTGDGCNNTSWNIKMKCTSTATPEMQ